MIAMLKRIIKNLLPYFIVKKIQNRKAVIAKKMQNSKYGQESRFGKLQTSWSDHVAYPNFCLKAANDLLVFQNFRQSEIYRRVLEHVNIKTGELYLEEIIRIKPDLINEIDKIKTNDLCGNPSIYEYKTIGKISPSTLRYTKVLADLLNHFDSLDKLKIVEIGVGYGGQCRVINAITKPEEYTLVDIKPALLLAQLYLDGYILPSIMKYMTMNELKKEKYDLVISNYAFTELKREIQDVYLEKIILNSKHGYITYNEKPPETFFRSYRRDDLIKIIPNAKIFDEIPRTGEKNCIIVW